MSYILTETLSKWSGRVATQHNFEARGFTLHKKWQNRLMEFCDRESSENINRYWDECAAEAMGSAGKCNSNARKFMVEPVYRSLYLDQLALTQSSPKDPFPNPPLIQCLYEYDRRCYYDKIFARAETDFYEAHKSDEIIKFSIFTDGWMGQKSGLIPFARLFGEARGFKERRRRFTKKSPNGIVFEFFIDAGGSPNCAANIPMTFHIYYIKDPDFIFDISGFWRILPGFHTYSYFKLPESGILGVFAHIEIFDAIYYSVFGE